MEDDIDSEIRLPQNRVQQIMRYGFPGTSNIRSLDNYVISYDFRNRIAYWTLEHLTSEMLHPNDQVDRSKCEFVEDKVIHPFFRSTNEDYKYSGYDRGHLAAAGNHRTSQKHVDQTFLLSNIAPQVIFTKININEHFVNLLIKNSFIYIIISYCLSILKH